MKLRWWRERLMKERTVAGFGARLAELRQRRGMSQTELGEAVGVTKRVIVYYESEDAQPPGAMLVDLARALDVTSDELLGLQPMRVTPSPKVARLLKRLERLAELPPAEQRAVLKVVDGFLDAHGFQRRAPTTRANRKAS
jgi:transcriptional regulator with XRE-family HTH domain